MFFKIIDSTERNSEGERNRLLFDDNCMSYIQYIDQWNAPISEGESLGATAYVPTCRWNSKSAASHAAVSVT